MIITIARKTNLSPQQTADLSAAASAGLAASAWVADLNAVFQLGATGVAILAGAAAAWWHFEKALGARRERLNAKRDADSKG